MSYWYSTPAWECCRRGRPSQNWQELRKNRMFRPNVSAREPCRSSPPRGRHRAAGVRATSDPHYGSSTNGRGRQWLSARARADSFSRLRKNTATNKGTTTMPKIYIFRLPSRCSSRRRPLINNESRIVCPLRGANYPRGANIQLSYRVAGRARPLSGEP